MATARSILDIDVNDQKWQQFATAFEKFRAETAALPGMWEKIGAKQSDTADQFLKRIAEITAANKAAEREEKPVEERRLRQLSKTESLWSNISKHSGLLYRNVLGVGQSILKWGSFAGAAAVGGAVAGFDEMAHNVGNERREAQGLGISIGQMRAFGIDLSTVLSNPGNFLSRMQEMETDLRARKPWYAMMAGAPMTGNAEQDAVAFMNRVRAWARRTPEGLLGPEAQGYDLPFTANELMIMRTTKDADWNARMSKLQADAARMNIPDTTAKSWQNLSVKLSGNLKTVTTAFETQLGRAAPAVGRLSDAAAAATVTLINVAGNTLAKDIVPKHPWQSLINIGKSTINAADWLLGTGGPTFGPGGVEDEWSAAWVKMKRLVGSWDQKARNSATFRDFAQAVKDTTATFGLPGGLLEAQKLLESGTKLEGVANSKAGAVGPFQFMKKVAAALGIDPTNLMQSLYGAAITDQRLLKEYHGNIAEVLAAYNWGEGKLNNLLAAHPKDWMSVPFRAGGIPTETRNYINNAAKIMNPFVNVTITNSTGNDVVTSLNQTAGH